MNRKTLRMMVLALVVLGLMACAGTFKTNAYKTLASGAAIYEAGYPAFLELHQKGLISDAVKANGKALAIKYWAAYHAATDALITYDAIGTAESEAKVKVALDEASRCLSNLSDYIQPFLSKGVK